MCLFALKDTVNAVKLALRSVEIKESLNPPYFLIPTLNNLGEYYFSKQDYDSATHFFTKAFRANGQNYVGGESIHEYKLSVKYLNELATITNNPYLLYEVGVAGNLEEFLSTHYIDSNRLKKMSIQVYLMIEELQREKRIYVNVLFVICGLLICVIAFLFIRRHYNEQILNKIRARVDKYQLP